jgi:lysophospholipase L1-like esterase
VINAGIGGERVASGAARIGAVLDRYKPGYVLITHGINDVETMTVDHILESLNVIVQAAKARQVLPAIATLTPWVGWREHLNPAVYEVNRRIRELASAEGILLVDGESIVEGRFDYVLDDALHFNEAGSLAIAAEWADRLM